MTTVHAPLCARIIASMRRTHAALLATSLLVSACASRSPSITDAAVREDASEEDASTQDAHVLDAVVPDASPSVGWPTSEPKHPRAIGSLVQYDRALGELEAACLRIAPAATFTNGECLCSDSTTTIIPIEEDDGSPGVLCSIRNQLGAFNFAGIDDAATLEARSERLQSLRVRIGDGDLATRDAVAREVARALESRRATSDFIGGARNREQHSIDYVHHLFVGTPSSADLRIAIEGAFDSPHFFSGDHIDPRGSYVVDTAAIEPVASEVAAALGVLGTLGSPPTFTEPGVAVPTEDTRSARALTEAVRMLRAGGFASDVPDVRLRYESVSGKGCIDGLCHIFTERRPIALDGGATGSFATFERVYTGGKVVREVAWVDHEGKLGGFALMGPNAGVGLFVVIDQDAHGLSMRTRVYDRTWSAHGEVVLRAAREPDYADVRARAHFVDAVRPEPGSALAVCDSAFESVFNSAHDTGPELFEGILFGRPARFRDGALEAGSLFGWNANPGGNSYDFASGLTRSAWGMPLIGTFLANERLERYGPHGIGVSILARRFHAAVKPGIPGASALALHIVPVAMERCFDLSAWELARTYGAQSAPPRRGLVQVVNMSFVLPTSDFFDRTYCPSSQTEAFEATTDSVLWVAAAGNHFNRPVKRAICPIVAMRLPSGALRTNGLVVAALNADGSLSLQTNYGHDFADIAADGSNLAGAGGTTSHASPRVAATAVLLLGLYPTATPARLRGYILFGARPRADLESIVRAAGDLDAPRAARFALCWENVIVPERGTRSATEQDYARCVDAAGSGGTVPASASQASLERARLLMARGVSLP